MKIGICTNMISNHESNGGFSLIPTLKNIGYDYVELPLNEITSLSDESFINGPLNFITSEALPCLSMNNFLPKNIFFAGPNRDENKIIEYVNKAFSRAKKLGVKNIGLGSGAQRSAYYSSNIPIAEAQLSKTLTLVAPIAQTYGLNICVEALNHLETNVINHLSRCVNFVRKLDIPNIKVVADLYHMRMVEEPLSNLIDAKDVLGHVHVARTLGRTLPNFSDIKDYVELASILNRINYDSTLSIEAYYQNNLLEETSEALAMLKKVFQI